jgi:hypothetical protein
MASDVERIVRTYRKRGAGPPDGGGYDPEDSLGVFKGLLWALPVSLYLWWLIWLCIRAYSAGG